MVTQDKRQLWEERVKAYLASGQTQKAWCLEQGLPVHQLQYWLKRFKAERVLVSSGSGRWVSLPDSIRTGSGVSLRFGDVVLEVERGFDQDVLVDVIRSLMSLC